MMAGTVKSTKTPFKLWDPNCQYLAYACELVMLYLLLSFYWMYTAKPMTSLICFAPTAVFCGVMIIGSFKQKILCSINVTIVMAVAAFLSCVLSNYPLAVVICMSLIVFFTFSSMKYRYMAFVASSVAAFGVLPSGWDSGLQRICETLVGFLCVVLTFLISELIFGKLIIRNTIKYISELVHDFFVMATETEFEKELMGNIFSKHLYKEDSLARTDLYLHEVFTTEISKFKYKTLMAFHKYESVFGIDRFFFKSNFNLNGRLLGIFASFRRIYRDMDFLQEYKKNKSQFNKLIPETEAVLIYIRSTLFSAVNAVRKEFAEILSEEKLSVNWLECRNKLKECEPSLSVEFLNIYYGFDFILKNIELLKSEIKEAYK